MSPKAETNPSAPPSPFISRKTASIFIAVMADLFLLGATVPNLGHVTTSKDATPVTVAGTVVDVHVAVRHYSSTDVVMIVLMALPPVLVIVGTLASRKVVAYVGWGLLIGVAVMHFLG